MIGKLITATTIGAVIGAVVVATAAPELNLKGNRFKPLAYEQLTPAQRAIVDREIAAGRAPGGGGPFNINLRSPELMELHAPVTNYLRFKSPVDRKLKELATMLTARYWGGQYPWYSHRQQALDAGLKPSIITAMAQGVRPAEMSDDEATMYDFVNDLLETRKITDASFKAFTDRFGERAMVETIGIIGHFTELTILFTADNYPVPKGAPDEIKAPK
jgi:4-carboxymuconolactone decarboxylase